MNLFEEYKKLLLEHENIDLDKYSKGRPTKLALLLSVIDFKFKNIEARIEKLEKEIHTLKPPAGFTG